MTFRTSLQADEDIANAFVAGAARFGVAQADRYQDGLPAINRSLKMTGQRINEACGRVACGEPISTVARAYNVSPKTLRRTLQSSSSKPV